MRRRIFIAGLGGTVAVWPLAAHAQSQELPVIAWLGPDTPSKDIAVLVEAFQAGLKEGGYVDGTNVKLEHFSAQGQYDRLPKMAADLAHRHVRLIMAAPVAAKVAKDLIHDIPIVFVTIGDPVTEGLVRSLSHPGGNVTGMAIEGGAMVTKQVELLHELIPTVSTAAVLLNPGSSTADAEMSEAAAAARSLGISLVALHARTAKELETAFARIVPQHIGMLIVGADPFFFAQRAQLVALAAQARVPAVYHLREFAVAGGLMSYGPQITEAYRQAGIYAGRILGGENPADLPVIEPTKFELVINLKAAKALGLTVPASFFARADQVIE